MPGKADKPPTSGGQAAQRPLSGVTRTMVTNMAKSWADDPQSAVVFIGTFRNEVVAIDCNIGVRHIMCVSCAFDHWVLDGATAGRFTAAVKRELEQP